MRTLNGKVAVVTGAASGIGRELALGLAGEGCSLAIADVDKKGLEETSGIVSQRGAVVRAHVVDVSQRLQVHAFSDAVVETFGGVHLVINNAGVGLSETVEDMTYEDFEWIMGINFWGVVYGTKAFLPHLKRQPEAHLVNVSSVLALVAVSAQSAYTATKFAVRGFTEALQQELWGSSVTVSCVYPGGTKTNIARNARFYKSMDGHTTRDLSIKRFEEKSPTTAARAASAIISGIKKNRARILVGVDTRMMDLLQRVVPSYYDRVLSRIISLVRMMGTNHTSVNSAT